ncbi:hypothetical protein DM02DRAFT_675142 [Periconia macrospinosa]|uniref:ORC6 first cyclin-like domain-containing protein n=1 Tax=Periconia macrospinosa TaxID=97972 RepID=A0A2V1DD77_9PLEO|nr:hypothetical protein DM02DRAFT_675142 [Periconia macrospinosa]
MSRATIEQSLNNLLPTLNGILPEELLDLALSLLALSRSNAHSLKPDEEIARPYACAQLACERLKKRLNLPAITSRPPCPPRIYKKLYKYLESVLPTAAPREPQTPRKSGSASAPQSGRATPKTPLSAKGTPRTTRKEDHTAQDCPEWVMPAIRDVARAFSYPNAAPHIYTGVASILPLLERMAAAAAETPSKRPRRTAATASSTEVPESRVLGLIAVILFYVLSRILNQHITPERVIEWQNKAIDTLVNVPNAKNVQASDIQAEMESLMPMAQEEGWLQMEWFSNVALVDDGDDMDGVETSAAVSKSKTSYIGDFRNGSSDYIGLGTMMQDATDYLGTRQREEYKIWKAGIMARVEEIEAAQS